MANYWNTDCKAPPSRLSYPGANGFVNFVNYGAPYTCACFGDRYEHSFRNSTGLNPSLSSIKINTTYFPNFENIQDPHSISAFFNFPVFSTEPILFPTCTFLPRIKNRYKEKLGNFDFMVIPNPSSNEIKILSLIEGESFQVETVTGKILYKRNNSGTEFLLDISKFKFGIYFVHISSMEGAKSFYHIINH